MYQTPDDILDFDIGGTHKITTTKKTLMKFEGSVLEAMFSGRHSLTTHNGRIFIDRDGSAFCNMITYLRTGLKPPFKDEDNMNRQMVYFRGRTITEEERMFYRELEYWQVPTPENYINIGDDDQLIEDAYEFNSFN